MSLITFLFNIILFFQFYAEYKSECERNIFERCTHQSEFSEQEVDSARIWLQRHIYKKYTGAFKPRKSPCRRMHVRKDFKCMSESERGHFIEVVNKLYAKGVIDRFADIHSRYWPIVNKSIQFSTWHRWVVNEMEREMRKISPDITLPYYNSLLDFSRPEKSMVWKYLGTTGNHYNGWCVRDGMYNYINTTRCVRRQWNRDKRVPVIQGPEIYTIMHHLSKRLLLGSFFDTGLFFITQLAIGGYYSDLSLDTGPNDILYYLWHNYVTGIHNMKYILQDIYQPIYYNELWKIDQTSGQLSGARLESDVLVYFNNVSILEADQLGFGQLCSLTDQMVSAINQKIRNDSVVPLAVKRMSLSIKAKYFPQFLSGRIDPFSHVFEEVGDCNQKCQLIPQFQPYVATENGRRLLKRYTYDESFNMMPLLILSQAFYAMFIKDMNLSGYCSPYIP